MVALPKPTSSPGQLFAQLLAVIGWVLIAVAVYYDQTGGAAGAPQAATFWFAGVAAQVAAFFLKRISRGSRKSFSY